MPPITNYDRNSVKNSISSNINAVEGNEALVLTRKAEQSKKKYNIFKAMNPNMSPAERNAYLQYFYSEEELMARKQGYTRQITKLEEQLKTANSKEAKKIKKEIKNNKDAIKIEEAHYENYKAIQAVRNNPSDFSLKMKQKWTQLKAGTLSDPLYPLKGLCSLSVKVNNYLQQTNNYLMQSSTSEGMLDNKF